MKLKEVLLKKEMSQKELVELTGLRPNTISEMANNTRQTINREHVAKVLKALEIEDFNEIFEIK
ncbi:TPA: helix-turn-helix transcriptional regulator [Salmonella enterica subsp. enterica serovar Typhi str. AG3]|nr:helix-turn-helix transcriptional regulator [Salmonella enterica subsp. enterica serovar Typhi str. AG3]